MKLFLLILIVSIHLIIFLFAIGWFIHSQEQPESDPYWKQDAIVLEIYNSWHGREALVEAENGERYVDYCYKCLEGDEVVLRMYKDWVSAIILK